MKRKPIVSRTHASLSGLWILLCMLGLTVATLLIRRHKVSALPEYSVRTGESCAACHVNPGGGGPRTLAGMLWSARGRPDQVPELPGLSIAPRVTNEVELYEIACGGCHGAKGEGLSAMRLANTRISQRSIESFTRFGIPQLGMPGFEDKLAQDQMEKLVRYVTGLSNGEVQPAPDTFDLSPALFRCPSSTEEADCGPVYADPGGN